MGAGWWARRHGPNVLEMAYYVAAYVDKVLKGAQASERRSGN
jgi:hypothetical protein